MFGFFAVAIEVSTKTFSSCKYGFFLNRGSVPKDRETHSLSMVELQITTGPMHEKISKYNPDQTFYIKDPKTNLEKEIGSCSFSILRNLLSTVNHGVAGD